VRIRVDRDDRVVDDPGASVVGELVERERAHLADSERLGHGERPVHELAIRSDESDGDAVFGEGSQREHRLECRDTGAGDQDTRR
jgi:hypothetical protein